MKGTIKASAQITRLFQAANKTVGRNLLVFVQSYGQRDHGGRVAFIAGKKLGSAPLRNRAKRRMREAARLAGLPKAGLDVLLVARAGADHAQLASLVAQISQAIDKDVPQNGKTG